MNAIHRFTVPLLAGLCLVSIGCQPPEAAQSDLANRSARSALDRVNTGPPVRKTIRLYTEQPGRVAAFEQTPMFSKLAGYVEKVHVDIGDRVKAGQVLLTLSVPEYRDELEQKLGLLAQAEAEVQQSEAVLVAVQAAANSAKSMVVQAEASIGRAEGNYARWDSERKRIEQLVNTGSVTAKLGDEALNQFRAAEAARKETLATIESAKSRLQEAEANIHKSKSDIVAAQAKVRVAQAHVSQSETMMSYRELRAPFDGIVTHRNADTGHYVPAANAEGSQPLLTVASSGRIRVFVDIPEMEAPLVTVGYGDDQSGDTAIIRSQSINDVEVQGRVTRSSWSLDSMNRSLTAEIDVPNENGALLPGSYVTVSILLEQRDDVLTLPVTAIVSDDQETRCCVVVNDKVEFRPIQLGLRSGPEVEIASGLDGSEMVVLKGAASLMAGQSVQVIAQK